MSLREQLGSGETSGLRARVARRIGVAPAGPLLVLAAVNFFDEFDRFAFAALTPEIRDAFSLSDSGIGALVAVAGAFILVAALPLGILADRFSRVRIATGAAILWGGMSVLTGLVPTVALLFVVRLLAGVGRVTNEVVHPSLLTDYYEPSRLPRAFMIHRLANPVSQVAGLGAGVVAGLLGWRWAFVLLAVPAVVLVTAVSRLREPDRGESLDPDLAAEATGHVGFGEARRRLFAVTTLRRLWAGAFFLGAAIVSVQALLALYFEQVFEFGPVGRGTMVFVMGSGQVAGFFVGLRLAERAVADGDEPRYATIVGGSGLGFGAALFAVAVAPSAPLALVAVFLGGVAAGSFNPAYFPLVGRVAPPRVRSQAYAWAILLLAAGALGSIVLYSIGESSGYRVAIAWLAASVTTAGLLSRSARRHVARDIDQAEAALTHAQQLRSRRNTDDVLLACRGVEVAYDRTQVLFGADIEIRAGEVVALLGTNGAGKSTLLKAISGLVDPIGGSIVFDGQDITHAGPGRTAELGIAQVPGGRAVFPTLTVEEHLRLAGWLQDDASAHAARVEDVLGWFPRLQDRIRQPAGNLSGGEQQMLGLAMAFLTRPRLLMIDELSLGLAPAVVEHLLVLVRRIRDAGTAVVIVEQSVNVALSLAERAYFMEKGEVRFDGPTEELLGRDDLLRSVFLEGAASLSGDGGQASPVSPAAPESSAAGAEPVLETRGLVRTFGGIRAVDDVSLSVGPGEAVGVIGPNGAGKTTLFDLISGFVEPDAGSVRLAGGDVTGLPPYQRAWRGLGRSFQDARLVPSLTTAENLAIGLERHLEFRDHLASTLAMPEIVRLEEDVAWTVDDLVELMGLGAYRDKLVRELSTGTRRVVDLAMVIAHDPDVLLLDEPSSGIAQKEAEALGPLLRRIREETGCALLVIEHDMPLVTSVADRLIAMDLGRPIAVGAPREVVRDPQVVESYLGGDRSAIQRSGARS